MRTAIPIVNSVESGIRGGWPMYGARAALTEATIGVKMKSRRPVLFVAVEVVFVAVV